GKFIFGIEKEIAGNFDIAQAPVDDLEIDDDQLATRRFVFSVHRAVLSNDGAGRERPCVRTTKIDGWRLDRRDHMIYHCLEVSGGRVVPHMRAHPMPMISPLFFSSRWFPRQRLDLFVALPTCHTPIAPDYRPPVDPSAGSGRRHRVCPTRLSSIQVGVDPVT